MLETREIPLRKVKIMGGIGMILPFLSAIPHSGTLWGIGGMLLVLIALKFLSDETQRKSIFNDYLIGVCIPLVAGIILFSSGFFRDLESFTAANKGQPTGYFSSSLVAGLMILWLALVSESYFVRRSFTAISEVTGENLFASSGALLFWGSVLLIIVVGAFVTLFGQIRSIVAFFSLPNTLQMEEPSSTFPSL